MHTRRSGCGGGATAVESVASENTRLHNVHIFYTFASCCSVWWRWTCPSTVTGQSCLTLPCLLWSAPPWRLRPRVSLCPFPATFPRVREMEISSMLSFIILQPYISTPFRQLGSSQWGVEGRDQEDLEEDQHEAAGPSCAPCRRWVVTIKAKKTKKKPNPKNKCWINVPVMRL